jgi:hypothetical protein
MYKVEWDETGKAGQHRVKTGLCLQAAESLRHVLIINKYGKNVAVEEQS